MRCPAHHVPLPDCTSRDDLLLHAAAMVVASDGGYLDRLAEALEAVEEAGREFDAVCDVNDSDCLVCTPRAVAA